MDKSPLCTCLMKQDLEEAADPYEFLDKNYSISGIALAACSVWH